LPDPLAIGHGLGGLFRRAGAVQAGCGEPASRTGANATWTARGVCNGELRSLAVGAPGRAPVLLYGAAARYAGERATDGTLISAETAAPGSGELAIVTTAAGSSIFVRETPTLEPGRNRAMRCEEISEVARSFTMLPPPMAALWRQYVRRSGWTWPVAVTRGDEYALIDPDSGTVVATGACSTATRCELSVRTTSWPLAGTPTLTVADLAPYFPTR
jgi:hypothetical protein